MSDIASRFIRVGKAPAYLGMCRRVFDVAARPSLREISIGKQGIAFDRKQLDRFADEYAKRMAIDKEAPADNDCNRSERRRSNGASNLWGKKHSPGSRSKAASGTSTNSSAAMDEFEAALAKVFARKPNSSSSSESSRPAQSGRSVPTGARPSALRQPAT